MPYIDHDGTIGGRKSFLRLIIDFLQGIIDFIALFFGALTNPPQRIENRATVRRGMRSRGAMELPFRHSLLPALFQ